MMRLIYHYHRIMKKLYKRPGAWQNRSFAFHHEKIKNMKEG